MSSKIPKVLKKFSVIIPKGTIISTYLSETSDSRLGWYFTYYTSELNNMYKKDGMFKSKCKTFQAFFIVIEDLSLINLPYTPSDTTFKNKKIFLQLINYIDSHYIDIEKYIREKNLFNYSTYDESTKKKLVDMFIITGKKELLNTIANITDRFCISFLKDKINKDKICTNIFKKNENMQLINAGSPEVVMCLLFNSLNLNGWVRFFDTYVNSSVELSARDNILFDQLADEIYLNKSKFNHLRELKRIKCGDNLQYKTYQEIIGELKQDPIIFKQPRILFYNSESSKYEQKYLKYKQKYLNLKRDFSS
jgi:hypothetical protein